MKARAFFHDLPKRPLTFELGVFGFFLGVALRSSVEAVPASAAWFMGGAGLFAFLIAHPGTPTISVGVSGTRGIETGPRLKACPVLDTGAGVVNKRSGAFMVFIITFAIGWIRAHVGGGGLPTPEFIETWRAVLDARITLVFPPPVSHWVAGLLLGHDDGFSLAWKDAFIATGTSHLTAVSGYNVSVVLGMIDRPLSRLPFRRPIRVAASFLAVILFVLLTGAPASVTRAAFMAGTVMLARETIGRPVKPVRALLLAALVLTAFEPRILLHDLGFQLSALATFGLVALTDPLMDVMPRRIPKRFKEWTAQTVAATVTVAPLVAAAFGTYSLVSLPANVVVAAMIPMIMGVGAGLLGFGFALPAAAQWGADLFHPILYLPLAVIRFFGGMPHALLNGAAALLASAAGGLAVASVIFFWSRKRSAQLFPDP